MFISAVQNWLYASYKSILWTLLYLKLHVWGNRGNQHWLSRRWDVNLWLWCQGLTSLDKRGLKLAKQCETRDHCSHIFTETCVHHSIPDQTLTRGRDVHRRFKHKCMYRCHSWFDVYDNVESNMNSLYTGQSLLTVAHNCMLRLSKVICCAHPMLISETPELSRVSVEDRLQIDDKIMC